MEALGHWGSRAPVKLLWGKGDTRERLLTAPPPNSLPLSAPDWEQQLLQSILPFLETGVGQILTSSQPQRAPPPPLHEAGRRVLSQRPPLPLLAAPQYLGEWLRPDRTAHSLGGSLACADRPQRDVSGNGCIREQEEGPAQRAN